MAQSRTPEIIKRLRPLEFPWQGIDPFLMCAYQNDVYPAGNEELGPLDPLTGRSLGEDFSGKDGWSMYHGEAVPGFPRHAHRGFETVTIVRKGFIDHTDSLGCSGRYGPGDVQWMTAGRGISHSEMTPLLDSHHKNPVELFQIWLNLPKDKKLTQPTIKMIWADEIPSLKIKDENGRETQLILIAGSFLKHPSGPLPPPHSWGADPENELAIWTVKLAPLARFYLPAASPYLNRTIYYFRGRSIKIGKLEIESKQMIELHPDLGVQISNGTEESEILLLQAKPIGEPIVQGGPFVMNTQEEIQQAYVDYHRTHFGGWPWKKDDVVFSKKEGRFVKYANGTIERRALFPELKNKRSSS